MSAEPLESQVSDIAFDRSGGELTAYISGELDAETVRVFFAQIVERTRPDDVALWLNLSGVTFCASAGVGLIIKAHNDADARGSRAVVYSPSKQVLRTLEMCNLITNLKIRTSKSGQVSAVP